MKRAVLKALLKNGFISKSLRTAISKKPAEAFWYAMCSRRESFPEGETAIAKDTVCAFWYAQDVLKGPFKLGEPAIAKDSELSLLYAKKILGKKRFPLGEPAIARNPSAIFYALNYLKLDSKEATKWANDTRSRRVY